MQRIFLLLVGILAAPVAAHCDEADTKTLRVFIFAGQSNMVGTHSRVEDIRRFPPFADLDKPQSDVLYSYNLGRETKQTSNGPRCSRPSVHSRQSIRFAQ